ncbi:putative RTA1 domain protein [Leptodontidium sp. 2 PMI_412]|nr:putative RTA1 domain protein [Leptodontidium sp. 2 PMI_412]
MALDPNYKNAPFAYYRFEPSLAAAIIIISLFALTTILHTWQLFRTRVWFAVPFVLGGYFEIIGYVGRALSAKEDPGYWTIGPYVIQAILILVAPALFAATIYMQLGRIIVVIDGESLSLIRKKWLTKTFVFGDVSSFLLQGGGTSQSLFNNHSHSNLSSNTWNIWFHLEVAMTNYQLGGGVQSSGTLSAMHTGEKMIIAGLFVQIVFFGCFVITSSIFHIRLNRSQKSHSLPSSIPWRKHMWTLYIASILILARSIFRVVEYLQGSKGYLLSHEFYLYIFDATLMFFTMLLLNWVHPSEIASLINGRPAITRGYRLKQVATLP